MAWQGWASLGHLRSIGRGSHSADSFGESFIHFRASLGLKWMKSLLIFEGEEVPEDELEALPDGVAPNGAASSGGAASSSGDVAGAG
eukprot:81505-Amphidinium_carterae.1